MPIPAKKVRKESIVREFFLEKKEETYILWLIEEKILCVL